MVAEKRFRHWFKPLCLAIGMFTLTGCYHATIETGLAPSSKTKSIWAHSWVYGLVPPAVVNAQSECESGVARVETKHSFVTGLIGGLTYGIYTPMKIIVTCAEGKRSSEAAADTTLSITVPSNASQDRIVEAFAVASDLAVTKSQPAFVVFQ